MVLKQEIEENITKKDLTWKQAKIFKNDIYRIQYNIQKKLLTNIIRREKRKYYATLFTKYFGDMKKTWETINQINNKIEKSTSQIIGKNFKIRDGNFKETSNNFNNYFIDNINKLNSSNKTNNFNLTNNIQQEDSKTSSALKYTENY